MTEEIKTEANHGNSKYKPEYCEMLINHMADGYSFESFGSVIKVGKKTMYNWIKDFPEWAEAKDIAEASALKFFETAVRSHSMKETIDEKIIQKKFNPKNINVSTIMWIMKSRFHQIYSDRQVTVLEGGDKPIQTEHKIDLSKLSIEELKQLKALKEKIEPTKPEGN